MYALIKISDNSLVKVEDRTFEDGIPDISHKDWEWRGYLEDDKPAYIPEVQTLSKVETVEPTQLHVTWDVVDRDLVTVKTELKNRIDRDAESERMKYLTSGAGQAQEYQEALQQAKGYTADSVYTPVDMLQASINAGEAVDLAGAATLIIGRYDAWRAIGAGIREKRLTGKAAIDASADVTAAWNAYQAVTWV